MLCPSIHGLVSFRCESAADAFQMLHVSQASPMGMIFIPSTGGRVHCPKEQKDILNGMSVLEKTVQLVDTSCLISL